VDGRGRRNINFATWTARMVTDTFKAIKITCPDLPAQSSKKQSSTESGKRRYSEPSQVIVVKNRSIFLYVDELDGAVMEALKAAGRKLP